jgi:DNA-binding transcriptional LysR family regulator
MNLRFVEAYHWAVTLKSVTRAAEKLHLTQSALSSRIAALEAELGVLLLDRRDKRFRLTPAGARFARHAERLLNLQREIVAELGAPAARAVSLRVGAIESVLHSWLIDWVQALRRDHPALELELTVESTPVLLDLMRRGAVDVVLAALPASGDGVRSRALAPMAMAFIGHAERHKRKRWTLEALCGGDELLTFQRGSQPHLALLDLCRRQGIDAPRVHTVSSISAMAQLVESGLGVATLPRAAVARMARPALKALACDTELAALPIALSWRDDPASPVGAEVIDSLLAFNRPAESSRKSIKR